MDTWSDNCNFTKYYHYQRDINIIPLESLYPWSLCTTMSSQCSWDFCEAEIRFVLYEKFLIVKNMRWKYPRSLRFIFKHRSFWGVLSTNKIRTVCDIAELTLYLCILYYITYIMAHRGPTFTCCWNATASGMKRSLLKLQQEMKNNGASWNTRSVLRKKINVDHLNLKKLCISQLWFKGLWILLLDVSIAGAICHRK